MKYFVLSNSAEPVLEHVLEAVGTSQEIQLVIIEVGDRAL